MTVPMMMMMPMMALVWASQTLFLQFQLQQLQAVPHHLLVLLLLLDLHHSHQPTPLSRILTRSGEICQSKVMTSTLIQSGYSIRISTPRRLIGSQNGQVGMKPKDSRQTGFVRRGQTTCGVSCG